MSMSILTNISRRDFMKAGIVLGVGGVAAGTLLRGSSAHAGTYLNLRGDDGYTGRAEDMTPEEVYRSFRFIVTNLESGDHREMPFPFPAHSINTDPAWPRLAVLAEKWGRHCCTVDYRSMEIVSLKRHEDHRQFIGHTAFHAREGVLYASEGHFPTNLTNHGEGYIGVRDPRTLELVREFPSYGENPHEILLIEDGATLVVCNQGEQRRAIETYANLAYIDTATGELIERLEFPTLELGAAHMRALSNGDVVMVTKVMQFDNMEIGNTIYTRFGREGLTSIDPGPEYRDAFKGEILSIDLDERRMMVGTTCPDSGHVAFWDLNTRTLKRVHALGRPLGIALTFDERYYVVNDIERGAFAFDAITLDLVDSWLPDEVASVHYTAPHAHIARPS